MTGKRHGVAIQLKGDDASVIVLHGVAAVYCEDGSLAGTLTKVHRKSPNIRPARSTARLYPV